MIDIEATTKSEIFYKRHFQFLREKIGAMALSVIKIKRKGIDEVAKMSHAKIEWLVSKWGIGPELCQYKNIVMKRLKSYAKKVVIPKTYLLTVVNISMKQGENLSLLCYLHKSCCFVKKQLARHGPKFGLLTTRILDTNALN